MSTRLMPLDASLLDRLEQTLDNLESNLQDALIDHEDLSIDEFDHANVPHFRTAALAKTSIVLPLRNPGETIEWFVARLSELQPSDLKFEFVLVDDGSTDGTSQRMQQLEKCHPNITCLRLARRSGSSSVIQAALAVLSGDIVVLNKYNQIVTPKSYESLLRPIQHYGVDAVFGASEQNDASANFATVDDSSSLAGLFTKLAALLVEHTSRFGGSPRGTLSPAAFSGPCQAIRTDVLRYLLLSSRGTTAAAELAIRLAQRNASVREVAVSPIGNRNGSPTATAAGQLGQVMKRKWVDTRFTLHSGMGALRILSTTKNYQRWLLDSLQPFIGQQIVDAGAGLGGTAEHLTDRQLLLVDHDPQYISVLEKRFSNYPNIGTLLADLTSPNWHSTSTKPSPDTILCQNTLSNLGPQKRVLNGFHKMLAPDGHCIVVVPAEPELYGKLDISMGHHRRYRKLDLERMMQQAGFEVVDCRQVCKLGALAWWIHSKILRRRQLFMWQIRFFNNIWPVLKCVDHLLPWRGMSVIAVGRKVTS